MQQLNLLPITNMIVLDLLEALQIENVFLLHPLSQLHDPVHLGLLLCEIAFQLAAFDLG